MVQNNTLNVTVARTQEDIEAMRPVWEQMQAKEPYPIINTDIDRFLSAIEASNGKTQPYILLIKQNDQPVAVVIARVGNNPIELKLGYKTFLSPKLRCLSIVYGGILGQPNKEICSFLIRKLMEMLRRREIDVICFNRLRTDSEIFQLSRKIPNILIRNNFPKFEKHWSMSVPENLDRFYQKCSKKHRGNLKRYIKKLEKKYPNQIRLTNYAAEHDLSEAIQAASQISRSTYQYGLGCGFTDNSRTRILLSAAAKKDWLRMSVLFINSEPAAFQVGLKYKNRYNLDSIGFDPRWGKFEVGTVLFLKVLEKICADPDIEYLDFGFGDAYYKLSYGDKQWQEASVYIFASRLYPIFINMLLTFTAGLNRVLEHILNKMNLVSWIKRLWRNLLRTKSSNKIL